MIVSLPFFKNPGSFCLFFYVHILDSYFVSIFLDFEDVFCLFAFFKQFYIVSTRNIESCCNGSVLKKDQNRRSQFLSFSMNFIYIHPPFILVQPDTVSFSFGFLGWGQIFVDFFYSHPTVF